MLSVFIALRAARNSDHSDNFAHEGKNLDGHVPTMQPAHSQPDASGHTALPCCTARSGEP